ncbi:2-polyprenyl-6-methoxyphenol hydroxylase-like FAD-dependent oxidoreductase [Bradyrhizobium sp. GM6.1]
MSGLEFAAGHVQCRSMTDASTLFDAAVIGGGPAGLSAAIALAQAGARTALVARRMPYADNRTTALLGASVDLLESLDVWPRCKDKAAALEIMRLVDDTGRLFRAPEVRFSCHEIGLDAFGYNIDNRSLMLALEARAAELPDVVRFDDEAETVVIEADDVAIRTAAAQFLSARLVVGADGRHSLCREASGIAVTRRELTQTALTFNGRARAAPPQRLDRVPHPAWSLRVRAPARRSFQRRLGLGACGRRAASRPER